MRLFLRDGMLELVGYILQPHAQAQILQQAPGGIVGQFGNLECLQALPYGGARSVLAVPRREPGIGTLPTESPGVR
jgi:hypothetical protein